MKKLIGLMLLLIGFSATSQTLLNPSQIRLTNAHIIVGNASNKGADVAMSGDATISNTGALSLVWSNGYSTYDSRYFQISNNLSEGVAGTIRTNIGATTVGGNIFTASNPSAIRWIRVNADNTITFRTAAETLSDIGAGTGSGTVTSVAWTTSQGVSASIANATTTPNITVTLGALTGVTSLNGLVVTANTGDITTGTWSATAVGPTKGGTGLTAVAQGDLLIGSATNVWSSLAKNTTATRYLSNQGVSNTPSWNQVTLTNGVTGVLPIANGGNNSSAALNNNRIIISSGSAIVENAAITASRALASDVNGIPVAATTTTTELNYVSGVTSAIQTQFAAKAPAQYYKTGQFYPTPARTNNTTNTVNLAAGTQYFNHYVVESTVTVAELDILVTTNTALTKSRFAIYNSTAKVPTTVLYDSGELTGISGTGKKGTGTISQSVPAGEYFFCVYVDGACTVEAAALAEQINTLGCTISGVTTSLTSGYTASIANTATAPPSTPTITAVPATKMGTIYFAP